MGLATMSRRRRNSVTGMRSAISRPISAPMRPKGLGRSLIVVASREKAIVLGHRGRPSPDVLDPGQGHFRCPNLPG